MFQLQGRGDRLALEELAAGKKGAGYVLMPYATVSSVRFSFSMSCFIRSMGTGEPAAMPVLRDDTLTPDPAFEGGRNKEKRGGGKGASLVIRSKAETVYLP